MNKHLEAGLLITLVVLSFLSGYALGTQQLFGV